MAQFSTVDESLPLAVERLESLEELGQRPWVVVWVRVHCFEDGQDILELVSFLTYECRSVLHIFIH